jgi:predicted nucleotidyltransferase
MSTNINKNKIKRLLINNQNRLRALGIKRVGIFGSYVRGEENKESDIDLLVEFFDGEKTFDRFMELSYFLEKIMNHRIELVTPEGMSPYIAPHILKEIEYADFTS